MDSEIIILSDDDDDSQQATVVGSWQMPPPPPPPPRIKKPNPSKPSNTAAERCASDRPCPKSKKRNHGLSGGDDAFAKPTTSVARPVTAAATPATSAVRPSAAARPGTAAARPTAAGTAVAVGKYPPPYPKVPRHATQQPSWKNVPPAPTLQLIGAGADGSIEIAWQMNGTFATQRWAEVKAYELYVCRETDAPPDSSMWRMVDVIADQPLPEGCVLVNCPPGVHHIALRAIDVHDRRAPFNKMVVTI